MCKMSDAGDENWDPYVTAKNSWNTISTLIIIAGLGVLAVKSQSFCKKALRTALMVGGYIAFVILAYLFQDFFGKIVVMVLVLMPLLLVSYRLFHGTLQGGGERFHVGTTEGSLQIMRMINNMKRMLEETRSEKKKLAEKALRDKSDILKELQAFRSNVARCLQAIDKIIKLNKERLGALENEMKSDTKEIQELDGKEMIEIGLVSRLNEKSKALKRELKGYVKLKRFLKEGGRAVERLHEEILLMELDVGIQ